MFHSLLVILKDKLVVNLKPCMEYLEHDSECITYEKLLARHARLLPALSNLVLVLVASCRIYVTIALAKGSLDGIFDLMGLGELIVQTVDC